MTYVDSLHDVLKFGTNKRVASICGVHMQPKMIFLANWSDFFEVVEWAARRGAQRGGHEERYQAQFDILLHDVVQRFAWMIKFASDSSQYTMTIGN